MAKTKHQKRIEAKERLEKNLEIYESLSHNSLIDLRNLTDKLKK